ncbi:recombinase family protein [uncultured Cohaesibacter sp.]|uniref:recombinase family protein n=1 Tax=uncultured Cohaesibacter sp. TaxID=1002546 RepID=UPI00292CF864|nr:recombinase family protein [uncultured Cohaesibacter sp.]
MIRSCRNSPQKRSSIAASPSSKQKKVGDGLSSQEARCREYASYKGLEVVETFQDDASGGLVDRPGIQSMLRYIRQRKNDPHVVIIDDISRLARGLESASLFTLCHCQCGRYSAKPFY